MLFFFITCYNNIGDNMEIMLDDKKIDLEIIDPKEETEILDSDDLENTMEINTEEIKNAE